MRSRQWIEQEIRRRIQQGLYAPGSRMPSHRQIISEIGASSVTLQKAFDRLAEQGYVEPRGARGTFVARALPNLSLIALVFPDEVAKGAWNRFWSTGKRVGEEWKEGATRFRCYYIAGQRPDSADHLRLCRDVAEGGLAGMVFINAPFFIAGSPVFSAPVPRVVISARGRRECERYAATIIEFVNSHLPEQLLARFAAAGRRRVAGFTARNMSMPLHEQCLPHLRRLGMQTRPEWWLGLPVSPESAECGRGVARLLFSGPERLRPDCLLVSDDNLVPHITAGILDAGVHVPRDLMVAAHANFPVPTRAAFPCTRFGPDMEVVLRTAIAEVALLAGGSAPRLARIQSDIRDLPV